MPRRVEPELLDDLPADDPRAVRSRLDLRRVNRLMGTTSILLRALDPLLGGGRTRGPLPRLVELGAGDGSQVLRLARRRCRQWGDLRVTLLDRQPVVDAATIEALGKLGWRAEVLAMEVFEWLAGRKADHPEFVVANLFAHHFAGAHLKRLLHGIAERARGLVLLEPRRSRTALLGSHLLGAVGCNAVTRHDAVLSVHAGFRDRELTDAWPAPSGSDGAWHLRESSAGLFSHLFSASRIA